MGVTQYVGARYVPHGWTEWNAETVYDGLYCVSYNYGWYISKKPVPAGVSPTNCKYWAYYSLSTEGEQELVELVNRFNPTEYLPEGTDLNTITTPGHYILGSVTGVRYVNEPFNPANKNGTLDVTYLSFPVGNVMQIVNYPDTGTGNYEQFKRCQYGTARNWRSWQKTLESNMILAYNFDNNWINNVDVFQYVKNEVQTRFYAFGYGCTNTPTYSPYFMVEQRNGIMMSWGGTGSGNSVAVSYWSSNTNTWQAWSVMPNSRYMNMLGFGHMNIRPIMSGDGPYKYTFYRKEGELPVSRNTMLIIMNDINGTGAAYLLYCKTSGNFSKYLIHKEDGFTEPTFSIDSQKNIVMESPNEYLDICGFGTNSTYGAISFGSPTFNAQYAPWLNPVDVAMNIPEIV